MATTAAVAEPMSRSNHDHPTYRITVDRYLQMLKTGIFREADPIFLWHGRLVEKMPEGRRHSRALTKLYRKLVGLVPEGWYVEQEQPIEIPDDGLPEPDLAVIRGTVDDDGDRAASSRKVALVVEVADSSLAVDSESVLETYAREAIPVYWIVNIPGGRVEVHSRPSGPGDWPSYRDRRIYYKDEELPVVLDGHEVGRILVRDILP